MNTPIVWALGGVAVAALSPALLRLMVTRGVQAARVLTAWMALVWFSVLAIAVPALAEVAHRCWLVLHDGQPSRLDSIIAALSVTALIVAFGRCGWRMRSSAAARAGVHRQHVEVARILGGADPGVEAVVWLPVNRPLAYSLSGRPPMVVASTGLRSCMDPEAVSAVLAHEVAHLARHHHRLVQAAELLATGFPWLPLLAQSPALVGTLVELDADAHAAHRVGTAGLRRALHAMANVGAPGAVPASALSVTGADTGLRLTRLSKMSAQPNRSPAVLGLATAAAAITVPVLTVSAVMAILALTSCVNF